MKTRSIRKPLVRSLFAAGLAITTLQGWAAGNGAQREAASWCAGRCDRVVTDWSLTAYQVIRAGDGYVDPMAASRSLAMMHLAMHDAVNAVRPRYQRYAFIAAADHAADPAVAASSAAHDVLLALYPKAEAAAITRAQFERTLLEAGAGKDIAAGTQLGKQAAAAVLAKRAKDRADGKEPYVQGTRAGDYRFTPPFDFTAAPHWRHVTPFALKSVSQFRTAPQPALDSEAYRRAFDEVKRVGGKTGAQRSADETHYAAFWYEFSDIGWNRVARAASAQVRQDLWGRARSFALLNMAMADAYIAGWDSKYHHNFWRPVTAVRLAAQDGNPRTAPDANFETLLPTPPVPDMPSTHSALGMAAATVLAQAFGRDDVPIAFASSSAMPDAAVRSFRRFSEAARENGDSRVKAGLHFRFAVDAGLLLGQQIGTYTWHHSLLPQHGVAKGQEP